MVTTSPSLPASRTAANADSGRDRRVTVFRVVAGLVSAGLLFGAMLILFLLAPWVLIGPEPGDYVGELHRWHHADAGALLGILVVGSLLASMPDPRRRPVLTQAALIGLGSMIVTSLLDELSFGLVAPSVILFAVAIAIYPAPKSLVSLARDEPVNLPTLVVAIAAAGPLLRNAWDNLQLQASDHSQHATEHHWSGSAALAVALALTGLLVASRRPGWRQLGAVLGLAYLYLGAAALSIPDHGGSWGTDGGVLALLGGAAFLTVQWLTSGRAPRSVA